MKKPFKPKQKFFRGQRVRIAKDLGLSMRHFKADCEAIVLGSYADQYGLGNHKDYSLLLLTKQGKPDYSCSWYVEHQLTLVSDARRSGEDLIQQYNEEDPDGDG